jgi:hypothetical protein
MAKRPDAAHRRDPEMRFHDRLGIDVTQYRVGNDIFIRPRAGKRSDGTPDGAVRDLLPGVYKIAAEPIFETDRVIFTVDVERKQDVVDPSDPRQLLPSSVEQRQIIYTRKEIEKGIIPEPVRSRGPQFSEELDGGVERQFIVKESTVDEHGQLTYTVDECTLAADQAERNEDWKIETHTGVPAEVLRAFERVVTLRKNVRELQARIESLSMERRSELQQRKKSIEEVVQGLYDQLPELSSVRGKRTDIEKTFAALRADIVKADTALVSLTQELERVRIENAAAPSRDQHVMTAEEKEQLKTRAQEIEAEMKEILDEQYKQKEAALKTSIDAAKQVEAVVLDTKTKPAREKQVKTRERKKILTEEKLVTCKERIKQADKAIENIAGLIELENAIVISTDTTISQKNRDDARKRMGGYSDTLKKRQEERERLKIEEGVLEDGIILLDEEIDVLNTKTTDPKTVNLPADIETSIRDTADQAHGDAVILATYTLFESLQHSDPELYQYIVALRKREVSKPSVTKKQKNGTQDDFNDVQSSSTEPSLLQRKTVKLFDTIVQAFGEYDPKSESTAENIPSMLSVDEPEAETRFDYSAQSAQLLERQQAILDVIAAKKAGGTPLPVDLKDIETHIQTVGAKKELSTLATLAAAVKYTGGPITPVFLRQLRKGLIDKLDGQIRQWESVVRGTELAAVAKKDDIEFKQKREWRISAELLRVIFERNNGKESKVAIKNACTIGLDTNNITMNDVHESFQALVPEQMPGSIAQRVREAGVYDWAEFKREWDSTYARLVAHSISEAAQNEVRAKLLVDLKEDRSFKTFFQNLGNGIGQKYYLPRLAMNAVIFGGSATVIGVATGGLGLGLLGTLAISGAGTGAAHFGMSKWEDKLRGTKLGRWLSPGNKHKGPEEIEAQFKEAYEKRKTDISEEVSAEYANGDILPGAIAHAFRSSLFENKKIGDVETDGITLSGEDRELFQHIIDSLPGEAIDTPQRKELAKVLFELRKNREAEAAKEAAVVAAKKAEAEAIAKKAAEEAAKKVAKKADAGAHGHGGAHGAHADTSHAPNQHAPHADTSHAPSEHAADAGAHDAAGHGGHGDEKKPWWNDAKAWRRAGTGAAMAMGIGAFVKTVDSTGTLGVSKFVAGGIAAAAGATEGYQLAKQSVDAEATRRFGKERLDGTMTGLQEILRQIKGGVFARTPDNQTVFLNQLRYLRRIKTLSLEHGEDGAYEYLFDKNNKPTLLYQRAMGLLHDAEIVNMREHLFAETEESSAKLETVLERLRARAFDAHGHEQEHLHHDYEDFSAEYHKGQRVRKGLHALGYAAAYGVAGTLASWGTSSLFGLFRGESTLAQSESAVASTDTPPTPPSTETPPLVHTNTVEPVSESGIVGHEVVVSPEIANPNIDAQGNTLLETATISSDGGMEGSESMRNNVWGTLDRFEDNVGPDGTKLFANHDVFREWRSEQLEALGYQEVDGRWGHPFTVHDGAKIELYMDAQGEPHARLIGTTEGSNRTITVHDELRFRDIEVATPNPEVARVQADIDRASAHAGTHDASADSLRDQHAQAQSDLSAARDENDTSRMDRLESRIERAEDRSNQEARLLERLEAARERHDTDQINTLEARIAELPGYVAANDAVATAESVRAGVLQSVLGSIPAEVHTTDSGPSIVNPHTYTSFTSSFGANNPAIEGATHAATDTAGVSGGVDQGADAKGVDTAPAQPQSPDVTTGTAPVPSVDVVPDGGVPTPEASISPERQEAFSETVGLFKDAIPDISFAFEGLTPETTTYLHSLETQLGEYADSLQARIDAGAILTPDERSFVGALSQNEQVNLSHLMELSAQHVAESHPGDADMIEHDMDLLFTHMQPGQAPDEFSYTAPEGGGHLVIRQGEDGTTPQIFYDAENTFVNVSELNSRDYSPYTIAVQDADGTVIRLMGFDGDTPVVYSRENSNDPDVPRPAYLNNSTSAQVPYSRGGVSPML